MWLPLPASVLDIIIAPQWHAPHWQCDSLGIPIYQAYYFALPWAGVSMLTAALLVIPTCRKRVDGENIFRLKHGKPTWNVMISLPVALVCLFLIISTFQHIWDALIPQTITADCNGSAEPITVTRHGPAFQTMPIVLICFVLWLLHLRALALSDKKR